MKKNLLLLGVILLGSGAAVAQNPFAMSSKQVNEIASMEASVGLTEDGDETLITQQPEGTLVSVARESGSYYKNYGTQLATTIYGQATSLVEAQDGSVYILNPITAMSTNSWVKAEKAQGDTVVVKCPALIYQQTNPFTGVVTKFYMTQVNSVPASSGSGMEFSVADEQDVKYTYKDGVLTYCNPADYSISIGMVQATDEGIEWYGYGDGYSIMTPVTATANAVPEGVEMELYTIKYSPNNSAYVNGAISGNKVYINNLPNLKSTATVVGTIDGDKVTFEEGQYLGILNGYHAFLRGFKVNYDEDGDVAGFELTGENVTFDYDAQETSFSTTGNFLINAGMGAISYISYYQQPAFKRFVEVAGTPQDPDFDINIGAYTPFDEDFGFGMIRFHLPTLDTDGNQMLTDKVYYNMFIDDELYEFTTDVYMGLSENLVDVPFAFTDDYWDIYSDGKGYNAISLYMQPEPKKIGIQAIYRGGGEEHKSNIVTYVVDNSAIADVEAKAVASVTYYDLSGRQVAAPSNGIYIQSTTYTDGTRKAVKVKK